MDFDVVREESGSDMDSLGKSLKELRQRDAEGYELPKGSSGYSLQELRKRDAGDYGGPLEDSLSDPAGDFE